MSGKLRVLISAILLAPAAAFGLGLGEIRLSSALNEPFSAEIDLVAAAPDELSALEAHLAAPEVFARYGLDRPAFLSSLEFTVGHGQDGRSVLLVRSRDAISEPFVSFLIDVNWPRGRLLREYTVLLDPPAMLSAEASPAPAPVAAPSTAPSAAVSPPPAPATPQEPPAPAAPAPQAQSAPPVATAGGSSYQVARGDTLYGIAGSMAGSDRQEIQRTMIALFRANPEAFDGNINQLRAGAILRVPSSNEVAGIAAAEAASEVRQQNAAWRAATGSESGRLKLVTPPEGEAEAADAAESSGQVQSQISNLQKDIDEQKRLLQLRNQELSELQKKLGETRGKETAPPAEPAPAPEPLPAAPAEPTGEAAVAPEDDTAHAATPAPAPKPKPKPVKAKPAPKVDTGPTFLDTLTDNWTILVGAAALLLLGTLGFNFIRRRRDEDVDGALRNFDLPPSAPVPTETMRLRAVATGDRTAEMPRLPVFEGQDDDDEDIIVEERPIARPKTEAPQPGIAHDETISSEAALDLDQADPLAEADFHMAYGLYDQAVDLVRMALQREPQRNDLKLKLAEIHFVAGDTNQFLTVARDLKRSLGSGADWDRIVIMGRQLAPDEPMFAGAVQGAGIDLSLEGGDNLVDLDLLSAPEGDEGLDIDLGKVAAASEGSEETGENTALEFDLTETAAPFTATLEIPGREKGGTVEMPTLELPSTETPTIETPGLKASQAAARDRMQPATPDSTAEMAIDDLGLDLGNLDNLPDIDDATAIASGAHEDVTQIARRDEETAVLPRAEDGTAEMPAGTSATSVLPKFDFGDIDLDIGAPSDAADSSPTERDTRKSEQMSQLEPVTMSEVGTKLDLARAYMDMGDPDGARNILQEVLAEGSASQKQEARRLIDSLPGA
ncbi:MAG TPA: FimV/HubP family polar landmark protein [Steroidobacteraceae bacterium]|nr:FimV/HubP family polar landmark protein [Steroidobacteraceae bacterium]